MLHMHAVWPLGDNYMCHHMRPIQSTRKMISSFFDFGHTITEVVIVHDKRMKQHVMYPRQLSNQWQLKSILVHVYLLTPCHIGLRAFCIVHELCIVMIPFLVPFYWCMISGRRDHIVCVICGCFLISTVLYERWQFEHLHIGLHITDVHNWIVSKSRFWTKN